MTIDIRRRSFLFGMSAATLVVAAPKKFFIITPPKPIIIPSIQPLVLAPGRLPLQQLFELQKKLDEQVIEVTAIPRWLYMPEKDYLAIVESEAKLQMGLAETRTERWNRLRGRG